MQTLGIAFAAGCCVAVGIVWFVGSSQPPTFEAIKRGCDREFPIESKSRECQVRLGIRVMGDIERAKLDRAYGH